MVIYIAVIDDLSGLAKAIKPTSFVSICANFKSVPMKRICHNNCNLSRFSVPANMQHLSCLKIRENKVRLFKIMVLSKRIACITFHFHTQ